MCACRHPGPASRAHPGGPGPCAHDESGASVAGVGRLRWGAQAPSGVDEARQRLIDAAVACIDRLGPAKTTLEDVASEANVSRATIYRYFGGRDELVLGVLLRELDRNADPFEQDMAAVTTVEEVADLVVASSAHLLHSIRTNPKLRLLLSTEGAGVSATIAGASVALFRDYADDLRPVLEDFAERGLVRDDVTADELAEWMLRVILSLLTVEGPGVHTEAEERRLLRAFLVPAVLPVPVAAAGGR